MESEYKVMLDVNANIEAGDQSSSDVKKFQMSRLTMALTTFTLCLATGAALFLFSSARVKVSPHVFKIGSGTCFKWLHHWNPPILTPSLYLFSDIGRRTGGGQL
ncbi:hypothetical protein XENOCAPTIV_013323, partial [Xenoophorus captivus]